MLNRYKTVVIMLLLPLFITTLLSSCTGVARSMVGDKNVLERTFKLDAGTYTLDIRDIQFATGDVEKLIVIDDTLEDSLKIMTDDNIFESLKITVDRDSKTLRIQGAELTNYNPSIFTITVGAALSRISVGGFFEVSATLTETEEVELNFMGAIDSSLLVDRLTGLSINAEGACKVTAEGSVERLMIKGSGAIDIDTKSLFASVVDVKLTGVSKVTVTAEDELYAEAEGTGIIRYSGDAEIKRMSLTGLAELIKTD